MAEQPIPGWKRFLAQFQDILVVLLLIAALISVALWLLERDSALPYEAMAILAIVLLNALMGYIQGSRAEQAVAALRRMSAAHAEVLRDGMRQRVPATEIVPGDIIFIEEGDTIAADGRVIQSTALPAAEAALTGESLPVSKQTTVIVDEVPLGDRSNMVFSGTTVTYGHGQGVVTATAMQTEMGRIARMLKTAPKEITPLQKELDRVGRLLGKIVIAIAVVMVATILIVEDVHGSGAGGAAGGSDGGALARSAADGTAPRNCPSPCGGRDTRLCRCHRLRQDGHAHAERDDRAPRRDSQRERKPWRLWLCTHGRGAVRERRSRLSCI